MLKGSECPESLSYQKKDRRAWPRPPFFWYDTDFLAFFLNFFSFLENWMSYQKKGLSFGMTTTQDIRDLFAQHSPYTKCIILASKLLFPYFETFSDFIEKNALQGLIDNYKLLGKDLYHY